jgi:glycosyltransferase involved in cell wall biosynthesis
MPSDVLTAAQLRRRKDLRITFVLPYAGLSGGIRVLAVYAERLQRLGHKVTVVSIPQARPTLTKKIKSLVHGKGWPKNPTPQPSFFDNIAVSHRVLASVRPVGDADVADADIVLATFWRTAPWVARLSPSKGAKAILLQGYEECPDQWNPEIDAAWRLPLHKIVISKWLVDLARNRFGDSNVHHVPNSVDTKQFHSPARGKQETPTVGMLYATLHLKGVDVSLAALERVRRKLPNLRVIAFGAEPISSETPLPDWVEFHFRPAQVDIPKLYGACDAWLCGSRQEGFHLPPLEAMACRCPVVSTRVGGPLDTVEQGVNGFLVDVEDSVGLGERLLEILTLKDSEWRKFSDAALATATRYTWDDATSLLVNVLHDIVRSEICKEE